jgi:hypothetical protein
MNATRFMKALQSYDVWTPVAFSAALSVIVVVSHISAGLRLKAPPTAVDVWVPAFFCFLPMTFFFASASHLQTRKQIKELEARIQQLEAAKTTAS